MTCLLKLRVYRVYKKKKKALKKPESWHLQTSLIPFVLWTCPVLGEFQVHQADSCCHQNWPPLPQEARGLSATMTGTGAKLQRGVLRCAAQQATTSPDEGSWIAWIFKVKQLIWGRGAEKEKRVLLFPPVKSPWKKCMDPACWFWHRHTQSLCSEDELTRADLQISHFKRLIKYYHCFLSY